MTTKKTPLEMLSEASPYIAAAVALISAIAQAVGEPEEKVAARVAAYCARVRGGECADATDPLRAIITKDLAGQ